jgi:hypothetical protein
MLVILILLLHIILIYLNINNNKYDLNINLNGDNYILLSIPLFKNSINIGNISNLFAKLFLIGPPNTVIYDSYV